MDVTCRYKAQALSIIGFCWRQIYALNLNMDEPIQLQFRRPSEIRSAIRKRIVKAFCGETGKGKWGGSVYILHCELATIQFPDFPQSFLTVCHLINSFGVQWIPLPRNNRDVTPLTRIPRATDCIKQVDYNAVSEELRDELLKDPRDRRGTKDVSSCASSRLSKFRTGDK